ncbi:tail fiber domain-containing protein [Dokdonia sinensis]|uniref:Tail fiber domain-containing protein n=1 Tax=Dokdonia sinensis TaxID=2479847 RepID=A0A3M0GFX0_9FLAO|nr:tail fiber domain-containing protein [Dokdonia sinensis]RMB56216.1 tail fiber domain-containing protein [Dokdonia sinensis]
MKYYFTMIATTMLAITCYSQVGINTIDPQSTLDVVASNPASPDLNDGLLIPRIDAFPGTAPGVNQNSMVVYLTTAIAGFPVGYYYWDNGTSTWTPFLRNIYTEDGSLLANRTVTLNNRSLTFSNSALNYSRILGDGRMSLSNTTNIPLTIDTNNQGYSGIFFEQDNFTSEMFMYRDGTNNRFYFENNDAMGSISFGFATLQRFHMTNDAILPAASRLLDLGDATNIWDNIHGEDIFYYNSISMASDQRLKENFKLLNYGIDELLKIPTYRYNYKNSPDGTEHLGVIAQEMKEIIPEVVTTIPDTEFYAVDYTALIPVLINAMKEQNEKIKELQKEVNSLKAKMN